MGKLKPAQLAQLTANMKPHKLTVEHAKNSSNERAKDAVTIKKRPERRKTCALAVVRRRNC